MLIELDQKDFIGRILPHEAEFDYISAYGYFDSATACGISGFLDRYDKACLVHINQDFRGQYIVLIVQKY
jgi:hypothetical protein